MLKKVFLLSIIYLLFCGCSNTNQLQCTPALFPYPEYKFKAEIIHLANSQKLLAQGGKQVNIFDIKLVIPKEWNYEKAFEKTINFKSENGRGFILSLEEDEIISDDWQEFRFIGCQMPNKKRSVIKRTMSSYYSDLYSFTDEYITDKSDIWFYYILWSKTKFFRNATRLINYRGENLIAYQRNIDSKCNCSHGSVRTHITIFPNSIFPKYITIAAGFTDDSFFSDFLVQLNESSR